MKTRKRSSTFSLLIKVFIVFSFIAIISFVSTSKIFEALFNTFIRSRIQNYFASEEFDIMSSNQVVELGGWVLVLDEQLNIIETIGCDKNDLSSKDIIAVYNGKYELNGESYYGTISKLENGYVAVALPRDVVDVKYTIKNPVGNMSGTFLLIVIICIAVFLLLYTMDIYVMSKVITRKTVQPILAISDAMHQLNNNNFDIHIECEVDNEFVYMIQSLESMIERLKEAQQLQREQQQEKIKILSEIGHDLRTPLSVIRGCIAVIQSGRADRMLVDNYLATANESIEHMTSLINTQLTLAHANAEDCNGEIRTQLIDMCELLRQIIISFFNICEQNEMELTVGIPDYRIEVSSDENALRRILNNIISNAVFHNEPGTKIHIELSKKEREVVVSIADTGSYIPLKELYEASHSNNKGKIIKEEVHFLGLASACKIIKTLGGDIKLETDTYPYTKAFLIRIPFQ